jgi:eukaryotic-like serine/threonine-protein kinase
LKDCWSDCYAIFPFPNREISIVENATLNEPLDRMGGIVMFCPKCGTPSKGKRFCTRCGLEQMLPRYNAPSINGPGKMPGDNSEDSLIGRKLDEKYLLEAQLGTGGMGAVYRAQRLMIGDEVAVKVMHPRQVNDPRAIARFRREAQVVTRLHHSGVATVYDFGTTNDGFVYLAMELVAGESLRDLLNRQGKLPELTALEIAAQLCDVLAAAHQLQIVHRDIKPENILVQQTSAGVRVKLLDFGIASLRDGAPQRLTDTGGVLGTPHYMSPEQCLGEALDGRADLYSLGIVLYEMLCGVVPFDADVTTAVIVHQVNQTPVPLRERNAALTSAVEAAVLRALAKQPDARPQTAQAFARELRAVASKAATIKVAPAAVTTPQRKARTVPAGKATVWTAAVPAPLASNTVAKVTRKTTAKPAKGPRKVSSLLVVAVLLLMVGGFGFQRYKHQPAAAQVVTSPVIEPTATPTPTPAPVLDQRWATVADQTQQVSSAENALAEPDQTVAVIAPGGQLALELRAGSFFGDGPGADMRLHSAMQTPVNYTVFVRNDASAAWRRIDINRSGFAQGIKGHDMGHHGVQQARQLLIRNEAKTDLSLDAISVLYPDQVVGAPSHHHTH